MTSNDPKVIEEKHRLIRIALDIYEKSLVEIDNPAWKFLLDKGGVKIWTRPMPKSMAFLRSRTVVHCHPSVLIQHIVDSEKRNSWDKMYTTETVLVLEKDELHEVKLQKRTLRLFANMGRQRIFPFVSYTGPFPNVENGYITCNTTVDTFMLPLSEDQVCLKIGASGFVILPHGSSDASIVIHFWDCDPRLHHSLWEKWVSPLYNKMTPHFEVDRMRHLVRAFEMKNANRRLNLPLSAFPPKIPMKDLSWISPHPEKNIMHLVKYYLGRDNRSNWEHVVTDRRVVVQRWTEPSLIAGSDICLKLSFQSDCWVRSMRCFVDSDKRVQWELCGTDVVDLWNDGFDHEIIEVQGGGPGRGYGCPPFSYVAHVYHMLAPISNNGLGMSLLAYEERENGDVLLAKFPLPHDPVQQQRRASYFDEVSVLFIMKSVNTEIKSHFFPRSALAHTLPLSPVEYLLLESVIELRNVLEVDAWIVTNRQLVKLSMHDQDDEGEMLYHKIPSMRLSDDYDDDPVPFSHENELEDENGSNDDEFNVDSMDIADSSSNNHSNNNNVYTTSDLFKRRALRKNDSQRISTSSPSLPARVTRARLSSSPPLRATSLYSPLSSTSSSTWSSPAPSLTSSSAHSPNSLPSSPAEFSAGPLRRIASDTTTAGILNFQSEELPSLISALYFDNESPSSPRRLPHSWREDSPRKTTIDALPAWVFEQILLLVGAYTTTVCSVVCRSWNKVCKSENVWRELVKSDLMAPNQHPIGTWCSFYKTRKSAKAKKVVKIIDNVLGSLKGWKKRYCEMERTQICWAGGLGKFSEVASHKKRGISTFSVGPTAVVVGHMNGGGISGHSLVGGNQLFTSAAPTPDCAAVSTYINASDILTLYSNGQLNVYDRNSKSVLVHHKLAPCNLGAIGKTHTVTIVGNKVVELWNSQKGASMWKVEGPEDISTVGIRDTKVAVGLVPPHSQSGYLAVIDVATAQIVSTFTQAHEKPISDLHMEESGDVIFTASKDGNLKLWDIRAGKNALENYWHKKCWVVSLHVAHNKLASGTSDRKCWYWDLRNPRHQPVCKYTSNIKSCINQLYITPDLSHLLASWETGVLTSWQFT